MPKGTSARDFERFIQVMKATFYRDGFWGPPDGSSNQRIGQLIVNAIVRRCDLFYIENEDLIAYLKEYDPSQDC